MSRTRCRVAAMIQQRPGPLLAVLLNPPSASSGVRSRRAVERAARALGFDAYTVANLFAEATATVVELNELADLVDTATEVHTHLAEHLPAAGGILAAWGVAGAAGPFRRERDARAAWLVAEASKVGHESMWMVGGTPRHPSRWHQYVADRHGRTRGGTFEERLAQVLVEVPLAQSGPTGSPVRDSQRHSQMCSF
ncbi:DUF1643 domain-containing protein [Cellulomonas soli]